jgi:hypothetical protein
MKFESTVSQRRQAIDQREAVDAAQKAIDEPTRVRQVQENILRARAASVRFARKTE